MKILDPGATARALEWPALVAAVEATIHDSNAGQASAPPRVSLPLGDDAVWLLMPALSRPADLAACKLITVHASNPQRGPFQRAGGRPGIEYLHSSLLR